MLSRPRTLPSGFIPPCLPTKAPRPPSGAMWLHEIKHDGFRVIARKDGGRVKLYSRPGNDLTWRFSMIVEAVGRLRSRSCIIDGEAVACDDNGVASFKLVRYRHHDERIFLNAFDLIELNGDDLRRDPLEGRRPRLEIGFCIPDGPYPVANSRHPGSDRPEPAHNDRKRASTATAMTTMRTPW
jgi:bifunctional non-homologous end joining protein LigD